MDTPTTPKATAASATPQTYIPYEDLLKIFDAIAGKFNASGRSTAITNNLNGFQSKANLIIARINDSQSFAMSYTPTAGSEVHIIVINLKSEDITVTLPDSGSYVNLSDTSLTVPADGYAEINVISDGSVMYIRAL